MKTITIQTRIDTNLKKNAENILSSIGLPIKQAVFFMP
ncbi:MAG: type II toxin-antitoxin system RelB/DinJ family antitoxin [Spirochaetia bacterium]|nr:type II toxin-antitoxin system RelB/DinJ family antitoxin [Spirochaetia bacterium]